jgi:hypothetical protein
MTSEIEKKFSRLEDAISTMKESINYFLERNIGHTEKSSLSSEMKSLVEYSLGIAELLGIDKGGNYDTQKINCSDLEKFIKYNEEIKKLKVEVITIVS